MKNNFLSHWRCLVTAVITLVCIPVPSAAHNTSWNTATISLIGDSLQIIYRIVQVDLLGAVDRGRDSTAVRSREDWASIMPSVEAYLRTNTMLDIDGRLLTDAHLSGWEVENRQGVSGATAVESLMAVIELNMGWKIPDGRPGRMTLAFNLLQNVEARTAVNWALVMNHGGGEKGKRNYQIVKRGEMARFDFGRGVWVDSRGKEIALIGKKGSWQDRLMQGIDRGLNRVTLETLFSGKVAMSQVLWYALLAVLIGALHSLSPGHGKAIIGAYFIGAKGSVRDALTLGVATAASHTAGVFILGIVVLYLFKNAVPDTLNQYLATVSGLFILGIGIFLFFSRIRTLGRHTHDAGHSHAHDVHEHKGDHGHTHDQHEHPHTHDDETGHEHNHEHEHDHDHVHGHRHITLEMSRKKGFWPTVFLGISGGMVPCPTALVILFLAISLNRVGTGLLLIVCFSIGLATTLTLLGILFAKGSKLVERYDGSRMVARLPVISSVVVIVLGGVMVIQSVSGVVGK